MLRLLFIIVFLVVSGFCTVEISAQDLTMESSVEELENNRVHFSYEFSESVQVSGNLSDELPFPFVIASPKDKFTVDSVHVNTDTSHVDLFLSLQEDTRYVFFAVNVFSKSGSALRNPIVHEIDTNPDRETVLLEGNLGWVIPVKQTQFFRAENMFYEFAFSSPVRMDQIIWLDSVDLSQRNGILTDIEITAFDTAFAGPYAEYANDWEVHENNIQMNLPKNDSVYIYGGTMNLNLKDITQSALVLTLTDFWGIGYHYPASYDTSGVSIAANVSYVSNEKENAFPTRYELLSAYPNPFNPSTQIRYELPESAEVTLSVYDLTGRNIKTLNSGSQSVGEHTVRFDADGLAAGVYMIRLEATGLASGTRFVDTKKITLVK